MKSIAILFIFNLFLFTNVFSLENDPDGPFELISQPSWQCNISVSNKNVTFGVLKTIFRLRGGKWVLY